MNNIVVVHPQFDEDGNGPKKILDKIFKEITSFNGNIIILANDDWEYSKKMAKWIESNKIQEIQTCFNHNFGWIVSLDKIPVENAITLYQYILNKNIKSLADDFDGFVQREMEIWGNLDPDEIDSVISSFFKAYNDFEPILPDGALLIGGSIDACLKEVMVLYHLYNRTYQLNFDLIYDG